MSMQSHKNAEPQETQLPFKSIS